MPSTIVANGTFEVIRRRQTEPTIGSNRDRQSTMFVRINFAMFSSQFDGHGC